MATETFKLGDKSFTLQQLRGMSDDDLRKLVGGPRSPEALGRERSKEISKELEPSIKAPPKKPVGAIGPRVRAKEATGESPTVPAPAIKPPAPSPVPAAPARPRPQPRKPTQSLTELLKEPEGKPELSSTEQAQVSALAAPTTSPRDKSRVEAMRESAKKGVIYKAGHELARPGERGHMLAQRIVEQYENDPDLAPILDVTDPAHLGWDNEIRNLAIRLTERKNYTREKALKAAHRIASAKVVIGDWPPGIVTMPETLDPKKTTLAEEFKAALKPQVEIVGFNRRGQTITPRAEGRVGYFFRMADMGGGALSGLGVGLSEGKIDEDLGREIIEGIREGKIIYDVADAISVNQEWAKNNPQVVVKLKQVAAGLTLFTPDATLLGGALYRGTKRVSRTLRTEGVPLLPGPAKKTDEMISDLSGAVEKLKTGDHEEAVHLVRNAERLEREMRVDAKALRDAVTMEEARLAEADFDAGDIHRIADEDLARSLHGEPGKELVTMNPAFRRRITEAEGLQTQDFATTFGLGKPYGDLLVQEDRLKKLVALGQRDFSNKEWFKVEKDLRQVQAARKAIQRNIEIRAQANKNVVAALRKNVKGEAEGFAGESRMFGVLPTAPPKRAVDAIRDEVAQLAMPMVSVDPAALEAKIRRTGKAKIFDAAAIRKLQTQEEELNDAITAGLEMGASLDEIEPLRKKLRGVEVRLRNPPTKEITANDLAELQDQLEQGSMPKLGLAGPGLKERGDMPVGESPVESLERATSALSEMGAKDLGIGSDAQKVLAGIANVPAVLKSIAFGLDADADLRKLPPELIKRIKGGVRFIDQSASDFNRLIRDGDEANKIAYLTGERVKFANGQRVPTSGVDFVAKMQLRIATKLARMGPEEAEGVQNTIARFHNEGLAWVRDLPEVERRGVVREVKEFWVGDELLDEIYRTTGRQPGVSEEAVTLNPVDCEIMETLLHISGQTQRNGRNFMGSSKQALQELLRKVDAVYGSANPKATDAVAQSIGVLGNVDEVVRGWTATKTAIPENLQRAYADLLQGKAFDDPEERREVMRLANEAGLGAAFKSMLGLSATEVYMPAVAIQRIKEGLDRVLPRGRVGKEIKTSGYNALQETIQWTKGVYTRGGMVSRPKYFHQNAIDRFAQLAIEAGFKPALINTARQGAVEFTTIPGVENAIRLFGEGKGEKVRDIMQLAGDRAAHALNGLFGAGGTRIEVNQILDGTDDVIMVGDKVYTAKVLRKIGVEEGAESSFDNTALRQVIMDRRRRMNLGALDNTIINDMAESISVRERYGGAVTLIEQGMEPRTAFRLVNKAYYDYATSVAKHESSSTGFGLALTTVEPYWAYKKNASRQIFNALMTPEAAYRMTLIRRATEQGADIVTNELYESQTDQYGVQVNALPERVRSDYFALKLTLDKHYKGKVPEGVRDGVRAVVSNGMDLYESGRYKQLTASGRIREGMKAAGLTPISAAVPPRPDESAYRGYISKRPAVGITPDMADPAIREYFGNQGGSRSHLAWVMPEDTIRGGMEHMAHTALIMLGTGVAMSDPSVDGNDILQWAGDYWDIERAPVVGLAVSGMMGAKPKDQRISRTLAEMMRDMGLYTEGEQANWGRGPAAGEAYYLPEGILKRGLYDGKFRSADEFLKRYEGTPMLRQMGTKGDILKMISATRGYTFTEGQRERTAEQELRRKRIEMRANIE